MSEIPHMHPRETRDAAEEICFHFGPAIPWRQRALVEAIRAAIASAEQAAYRKGHSEGPVIVAPHAHKGCSDCFALEQAAAEKATQELIDTFCREQCRKWFGQNGRDHYIACDQMRAVRARTAQGGEK